MAPGFGSAVWYLEPRCQADPCWAGVTGEGEDTRAARGGGFPAHCARRGPGPESVNVSVWEVVGFR